jgi:hypothetical protein
MSQIETPLTVILISVCLTLFTYSVVNNNAERIEREAAEKALAEQMILDAKRDSAIAARSLNVEIKHDRDPQTNIISVALYASSSYDNERDSMEYYWEQFSGNNVAEIKDSREESVLTFDAQAGNYGFKLTITDSYGASCTDTHWVNVAPEPNSCPVVIIKN